MSRRSRVGRQRSWSGRRQARIFFAGSGPRKRKAFTFERLEDRYYFSVTPAANYQTLSLSSDTPEGALALWQRELQWAAQEAAQQTAATASAGLASAYSTYALPTDPLFASQWHLLNTGQEVGNPDFQPIYGVAGEDVNAVSAWNQGYTGAGVLVAVNDTGVQLFHPDLIANLSPTLRYNAISGTNNPSPNLLEAGAPHGTAVAGIIGATANNGEGGSGVAPGATLVPIRLIGSGTTDLSIAQAFNFSTQNGIDVTNNSWGPGADRVAVAMTPVELAALRDSIVFGRGGLGVIHVFASGNSAGPAFNPGFQSIGNWDSSNYDGYTNSRYVITVTGVDHDGMYANSDGTFTAYPEAGSNVLVAAPTGSNAALNIADDTGLGSGIWTTDLVGDFGYNAAPLPGGFDLDRDFLADPDYTSRFNGTSAASPMAAGVVALILDANPNLSYRDVQEILVRSARQNAQFEIPSSGGIPGELQLRPLVSTWQTNQIGPFRDPDPWNFADYLSNIPSLEILDPIADPNIEFPGIPGIFDAIDFPTRSVFSHYEPQPGLFTNGAGYTVSQGYGVYSEMTGYGHGVVDAGLAVKLASQWHLLGQNAAPEKTFSTFVVQPGPQTGYTFPAAEKMDEMTLAMIVPGGIGGLGGFIDYWNEYFEEIEIDDMGVVTGGPFLGDDPPANTRGNSYWQFQVPDEQSMQVEWVEVKISLGGPAEDLDYIRVNLTSPEGTVSELNHYYADPELLPAAYSFQPISIPPGSLDPLGDIGVGGQFVWTFSSNRSWGESTKQAVIIDPATGEPAIEIDSFTGAPVAPFVRNWELHLENWSSSDYGIDAVEIVWHGKPIAPDAQRVQGIVGIDTNSDEIFNYNRYLTQLFDSDGDPGVLRTTELVNTLDLDQEPFAENILVEAFRVVNGQVEDDAAARFITGADGNYYFDLVPGEYVVRATDPLGRLFLNDTVTNPIYARHFRQEWHINEDWFYAPDRDLPISTPAQVEPGEIPYSDYQIGDVFWDAALGAPAKFEYAVQINGQSVVQNVPSSVKNLNFLIKQDAPPDEIEVNGTVFADLNGNGIFDNDDTPAGGIFVYWDANRDGAYNNGEQRVLTSDEPDTRGQYSITIPVDHLDTYAIGVIPPSIDWEPTNPDDAVQDIFAGPGDVIQDLNFFLDPPNEAFPPAGSDEPGNILGVVYADHNLNGVRDPGDEGLAGFRVFVDANENGAFDAGEIESITAGNGTFFLADVAPGLVRIDMEPGDSWALTSPASGFREVQLGPAGTVTGVLFGLDNLADGDWGDLPDSYNTLSANGGPSHVLVFGSTGLPGFYLGSKIDGELNGMPTSDASGDDALGQDDDGVVITSNGGKLQPGLNTLQVTVTGVGGMLNGWIDWNDNGHFEESEHLVWQYALGTGAQADINPGTHTLQITAPANMAGGPLAARFRWGEPNLGPTGPAQFGEVEDYFLANSLPSPGDYDQNGFVDEADLAIWSATFGSTTDLRADGNRNGEVDTADWILWRKNYTGSPGAGSSLASGSGGDGSVAVASATNASQPSTSPATSDTQPVRNSSLDNVPAFLQAWLQNSNVWPHMQSSAFAPRAFRFAPEVVHSGSIGSGSSTGSSANAPYGPIVTPPAVDASVTNGGVGGFTGSLNVLATSAARPGYRPVSGSVTAASSSDDSLLLVDQALADFDADSANDADDDSLVGYVRDDNDESFSDMALAAVLEDRSNWWGGV